MMSPESLNHVLDAGPRPGVVFLPSLDLDSVARLDAERGITPPSLKQAREATLAMQIMALANGPTAWGDKRYLVIGARPTGETVGLGATSLDNDTVQRIAQRYCDPLVLCYYQEQRVRGQRIGMIVISDSPMKPFRFAGDVMYQQEGQAKAAYRQGEIWLQAEEQPRLATEAEILDIQLDAARVKAVRASSMVTAEGQAEEGIDAAAWEPRATLAPAADAAPAPVEMLAAAQEMLARVIIEERVLVLCGPQEEGCALAERLAQQLGRELDSPVYRAAGEASPSDLLAEIAARQHSLVVDCAASPRQWEGALPDLQRLAQRQDCFVLLASVAPATSWKVEPGLALSLVDLGAQAIYAQEQLADLLASRAALPATGGPAAAEIADQLGSPEAVLRLSALAHRAPLRTPAQLADAVALAADPPRDAVAWFWALDYHQRYFVVAVALLGHLPGASFWRYYEQLVTECWRTREPALRAIPGIDDTLGRHLEADLSFRYPGCREAVLAEALQRYNRPLVWALPNLRDIIIQLGEHAVHANTAATQATRATIAEAVGPLAASDWDAVLPILQRWATQRVAETRLVASRTLVEIIAAGGGPCAERALAVLGGWANNVALEAGWAAPRHAHRVRWTAAWALGQARRYLDPAMARAATTAPLWTLARDAHPRVRQAVAQALATLAPLHLADLAGLLGYLADDLSKRVRSHVAAAMASYAKALPEPVANVLRAWAQEGGTFRRWTAAATRLLLCRQGEACDELLALAPSSAAEQDVVGQVLAELGSAGNSSTALLPFVERLAGHADPAARLWAVSALLAMAPSAEKRPAVVSLVEKWRASGDPALAATAAEWERQWAQTSSKEATAPAEASRATAPSVTLADLEEMEPEQPAAATPPLRIEERAAEAITEVQGPRRWLRQASLEAEKAQNRRELLATIAHKVLLAAAMAGMAYAVLRRFPYYDDQWTPVLVLGVLVLGYLKPGLGTALAAALTLLPLLYHAPALALGMLAFGALLFALSGSLSEERLLEKRLAVLAFPMLMVTPLALLLPFLAGALFRKRAAWVVIVGVLLAIVVGVAFGQETMGPYLATGIPPAETIVLDRVAPERWQSLGWLADLELFKTAGADLLGLGRQLVDAFTSTPLPLVQLGLWGLVAWLVGWGASQPTIKTGGALVALAALLMIACYSFGFPDLLGWDLPFATGRTINTRIVLGALAALLIVYGWPWARAFLGQAQTWETAWRYLSEGKDRLLAILRK